MVLSLKAKLNELYNVCVMKLSFCQASYKATNKMETPLKLDIRRAARALHGLCVENDLAPLEGPLFNDAFRDITVLADAALNPDYTLPVFCAYRSLVLELVARWITIFSDRLDLPILARLVAIFPEISSLVESYSSSHRAESLSEMLLLAYYRLLQYDAKTFRPHINPTAVTETLKMSDSESVKYLCLKVLALHQGLVFSEAWANTHIGRSNDIVGEYDGATVDLCLIEFLEAKRIAHGATMARRYQNNESSHYITFECNQLLTNIGGVLIHKLQPKAASLNGEYVPTVSSAASLRDFALALQSAKPVLLAGPEGSGKTFIIDEAAKHLGRYDNMVRVHLGDQTDAKTLVGTYSTGSTPGSFEWRPGILTLAVQEGKWVVVEDIDKAPTEILSVLLPLLEKRELPIPSRSETIIARQGFQIISTITTSSDVKTHDMIGERLWTRIVLPQQTNEDLEKILRIRFPLLANLSAQFVHTFEIAKEQYSSLPFIKTGQRRKISSRDLIKWISRCENMLRARGMSNNEFPSALYDDFFAEAVDCFASFIANPLGREHIAKSIGSALDIAPSRVQLYLNNHVPVLHESSSDLQVGRSHMQKRPSLFGPTPQQLVSKSRFALTNHSLRLIEKVAQSISQAEPLLLVGETGTGKTTVVQYVATCLNKNLKIINLSQQTELSDLIGGFKPVDGIQIALPIKEEFDTLFETTFSFKKNARFYQLLNNAISHSNWKKAIKLWKEAYNTASEYLQDEDVPKKKRRLDSSSKQSLISDWNRFLADVDKFEIQIKQVDNSFIFSFVEGMLTQALRNGDWVLLDEINLASPDTLESISELLVQNPSITVPEKAEAGAIRAHRDFRLFACMNPATDVGKRDLPPGIRSRFTEIYVESPDQDIADLLSIIDKYIGNLSMNDQWVGNDIAELYLEAKKLANENRLADGTNQKPHFCIRTLSRTLSYASSLAPIYGLRRSLYEGFCMCFITLLNQESEAILHPIIVKHTVSRVKNAGSLMSQLPRGPTDGLDYVQFKHYWLKKGSTALIEDPKSYIITPFVEKNLLNLARATACQLFPVLIQGPTSSGKTSLINYLAKKTGHKFVRINNHEHTDVQEYLGSYVSDEHGVLKFQEGVLVEAVRNGYWIVLDELNLAPTDVLEALNRLLDDNRELLIPETQEVVKPHPEFMLFATQNPPGLYGGRKLLSRAFRNRFLELHFDDIPEPELEIILRERCSIAPSYAKKIVEVYRQLSIQRQYTRALEQKSSFATLRDLFRWAVRGAVGYEELALHGYMLLAERVRLQEERNVVKSTIEKIMEVKLDINKAYDQLTQKSLINEQNEVVWTKSMRRLLVLVLESIKRNEPVLLVGETGCGKTTIVQILSRALKRDLHIVNAHQNMETGDIIGAQRPVRSRTQTQALLVRQITAMLRSVGGYDSISSDLDELKQAYLSLDKSTLDKRLCREIDQSLDRLKVLFEWKDGSLVKALKSGDHFLLDEISLADDSVLERLNSVLEPERLLLLSEKGTENIHVEAQPGFQFFATMNPGGDYGKKELSPALRNRFTEIWVPSMEEDFDDVLQIVESKLLPNLRPFASVIVNFGRWFGEKYGDGNDSSGIISLRDILSWIGFVNTLSSKLRPELSIFHGACMVFIDSVGTNALASLADSRDILQRHRLKCVDKLAKLLHANLRPYYIETATVSVNENSIHLGDFEWARKCSQNSTDTFSLSAPTTARNALRVIRAMYAGRPILLEGSPGVGKTSLITAIAETIGTALTRINLSEQTDLIDLFGSDGPAEGRAAGEFIWRDAPFLRAMQKGEWVLLDEMNLASQSVLEGLNACLDHRGEAYIPELDKTFKCHPDFRVFAAQNPQYQGGGRKGLPKSFLNRFTIVFVDMLEIADLEIISSHLYPSVREDEIKSLVRYIAELEDLVSVKKVFGNLGGPFEFNLRDTMRWLSLYSKQKSLSMHCKLHDYFDIIIGDRFRQHSDKLQARKLFEQYFGDFPLRIPFFNIGKDFLQAGHSLFLREPVLDIGFAKYLNLQCNTGILESMIASLLHSWPIILVGPSNSGKTSIVRYLAGLAGVRLEEFPMNGDIDSTDLLGGFDQVDISNRSSEVRARSNDLAIEMAQHFLLTGEGSAAAVLELRRLANLTPDLQVLQRLLEVLEMVAAWKIPYFASVENIVEEVKALIQEFSGTNQARFQWFDGVLLKAIENGQWLVLDNANLCNPSVLDRLNSLLEPDGCLLVNECSQIDGEPRVVNPHPSFRLFLTIDPKYGELSRAMRNRGIEIYMETLEARSTVFDRTLLYSDDEIRNSSTNVEDAIGTLSLDRKGILPVTRYLKSYDTASRMLALQSDAFELSQGLHSSAVQSLCVQAQGVDFVLSINSLEHALTLPMFKQSGPLWRLLLSNATICNDILGGHLLTLYRSASSNSGIGTFSAGYYRHQPYNPLFNDLFTELAGAEWKSVSDSIVRLLFLIPTVIEHVKVLGGIRSQVVGRKPSSLTYLERCVGSVSSPGKNAIQVDIGSFLWSYIRFVGNFFEACKRKIPRDDRACGAVEDIQGIVSGIVKLANAFEPDQSQIQVYCDILDNWAKSSKELFSGEVEIFSEIQALSNKMALSRGLSMELIWREFRPQYPLSAGLWECFVRVQNISYQVDAVSQRLLPSSQNGISLLKYSILELAQDIASSHQDAYFSFTEIIDAMESKVRELESSSLDFKEPRANFCSTGFQEIQIMIELGNFQDPPLRKLIDIASYTGRPTVQLLPYYTKTSLLPLPLYELLVETDDNNRQWISRLLENDLASQILSYLQKYPSTKVRHLYQNSEDVRKLGREVVINFSHVQSDYLAILSHCLSGQLRAIEQLHDGASTEVFEFYSEIKRKYLDRVAECIESRPHNAKSVGEAFILFSVALIYLYIPNIPFDPAIKEHVENSLNTSYVDISKKRGEAWEALKSCFFGRAEFDAAVMDGLRFMSMKDKPLSAYRPTNSQFNSISQEWNELIEAYVGEEVVMRLLSGSNEELDSWQKNISSYIERMRKSFPLYQDVTSILEGYLFSLKLGFAVLKWSAPESAERGWLVDPSKFASPCGMRDIFQQLQLRSGSASEDVLIQSLEYLVFSKPAERNDSIVHSILRKLFQNWSINQKKQELENMANQSIYTSSEVDPEKELLELFPDYETEVTASSSKGDFNLRLVELYTIYFGERKGDESVLNAIQRALDVIGSLSTDRAIYPIAICAMADLHGSITKELNFYKNNTLDELMRATKLCYLIKSSVSKILQRWPEHEVLQNIDRACEELLEYSISVPLARLLQKMEQILVLLNQWEKYASEEVSLSAELNQVIALIISWRRLELSTWNGLFAEEERTVANALYQWWFYLYENLVEIPSRCLEDGSEVDIGSITRTLALFLSEAPQGQFSLRLELLQCFSNDCYSRSMSKIGDAIMNIKAYYNQYLNQVAETLERSKKKLSKEIQEVILLTSWKDVNVDTLRESARKSHYKLYKIVRQYRDILKSKVSGILQEPPVFVDRHETASRFQIPDEIPRFQLSEYLLHQDFWGKRPARLRNISTTVSVMHNLLISVSGLEHLPLASIADYVVSESRRLQSETPRQMTEETKKVIASLKVEKTKLFMGVLKELRNAGFKYTPKAEVIIRQSQVSEILASSPYIHLAHSVPGEKYFLLILDLLPRLRVDVAGGNEDIPQSDLQRALGITENVVSVILSIRNAIASGSRLSSDLKHAMDCFKLIGDMSNVDNAVEANVDIEDEFLYVQKVLFWIPRIIELGVQVEKCAANLTGRDVLDFMLFDDVRKSFADKARHIENQRDLARFGVGNRHWRAIFNSVREEVVSFVELVRKLLTMFPESTVSLTLLESWAQSILGYAARNDSRESSQLLTLHSQICDLCDSILVVVQTFTSFREDFESEDSPNWYLRSATALVRMQKSMHLDQIISKIQLCLNTASCCESPLGTELIHSTLPFLDEYICLSKLVETKICEIYLDCTMSTYKLLKVFSTVARKGYCGPQEEEKEAGAEATKQGTGLGEGEGAQDHSNDIEDDEDLSDLALQGNKDREERGNEEGNGDAVDIEGDMAEGELEETSDQEDNESDDDRDEMEEDIEGEVGNIDDLDPNAIDEKLWDEPSEGASKDKESTEITGNEEDLRGNEEMNEEGRGVDELEEKDKPGDADDNMEEVGEQEDAIAHNDTEELEEQVKETEKFDLPDDLNLDKDNDMEEEPDDADDGMDDVDHIEKEEFEEHQGEEDDEENEVYEEARESEYVEEDKSDMVAENDGDGLSDKKMEDVIENDIEEENDKEREQKEDDAKVNEDSMDIDTEALGGMDDVREGATGEESTKAEAKGAEEAKGADSTTSNQEEEGGGQGQVQAKPEMENEEEIPNDPERDMANESVKQLGDMLKEFYYRRQEIKQASQRDDDAEESAKEQMDEFEHVEGENSNFDTQALGNADQTQNIDDSMAIDEEIEVKNERTLDEKKDSSPGSDRIPGDDNLGENGDVNPTQFDQPQGLSSIGKRREANDTWLLSLENDNTAMGEDEEEQLLNDNGDIRDLVPARTIEEASVLWKQYNVSTQELALTLCEQLRLILEPTLATKLRGDFKTGKRLNMKRIIPYIASQFKKDKIWMRRVKPSKRQYQILIAVDDSHSMSESKSVDLAFQTIALVSKALTQLEAGDLGIMRFGDIVQLVHPFQRPFSSDAGSKVLQWFGFNQDKTDVEQLLSKSLNLLENYQRLSRQNLWQLEIVISDGICENHERLKRLVRRAHEQRVMVVFVVIDGFNKEGSILDMGQVSYTTDESGNMNLSMTKYLDTFPFEYYVIVRDIRELPSILSMLLRQYFSQIASD